MSHTGIARGPVQINDWVAIAGLAADLTAGANDVIPVPLTGLVGDANIWMLPAATTDDPNGYLSGNTLVVPVGFAGWKELSIKVWHPVDSGSGAASQTAIRWAAGWTLNNTTVGTSNNMEELEIFGKVNETSFDDQPAAQNSGFGVTRDLNLSEGDIIAVWIFCEDDIGWSDQDFGVRVSIRDALLV